MPPIPLFTSLESNIVKCGKPQASFLFGEFKKQIEKSISSQTSSLSTSLENVFWFHLRLAEFINQSQFHNLWQRHWSHLTWPLFVEIAYNATLGYFLKPFLFHSSSADFKIRELQQTHRFNIITQWLHFTLSLSQCTHDPSPLLHFNIQACSPSFTTEFLQFLKTSQMHDSKLEDWIQTHFSQPAQISLKDYFGFPITIVHFS